MRPGPALALVLLIPLVACVAKVTPPKVEVGTAPVVVEVGGRPGFCPPGQAKKGNC
ncbi:hypothetical protein HRbin40_01091 [bacterium HR40]|nr:hypothetical protein HRbin40_01091 [bacterium HR40]